MSESWPVEKEKFRHVVVDTRGRENRVEDKLKRRRGKENTRGDVCEASRGFDDDRIDTSLNHWKKLKSVDRLLAPWDS